MTSSSGLATGSFRRRIWSISVKIAVFAPMPSARERIATMANSGLRSRPRTARRRSLIGAVIGQLDGRDQRRVGRRSAQRGLQKHERAVDGVARRGAVIEQVERVWAARVVEERDRNLRGDRVANEAVECLVQA